MGKRNWQEPTDYEDLKKLNPDQWAWEFLRRNQDYIQEWEKELPGELERIERLRSDPKTKDNPSLQGILKTTPENPQFSIHALSLSIFKKWGIYPLVNPKQDHPFPNPFNRRRSFNDGSVRGGNIGYSKYLNDAFPNCNYISVAFDVTRPLKQQFANAQKVLLELQTDRVKAGRIHVITVKKHKDNWIEYLRMLDAKAEKVKNDEIARVMFPNLSNEYPDYQATQRVRKSLKAANNITKIGYRDLALTY